jgi:single-strand DNA-binding protein
MDLNRVMLIGNLTRDPELRNTPNGKAVATMAIATNRFWTDAQGQKQKEAEFHNVVMWSKLAEIAAQYLHRGSKVYIEGRLQTREWTGQDGIKRYRTEIVADNMIMLNGPADSAGKSRPVENGQGFTATDSAPSSENIEEEIKVEDIPF